jgi:hypothetical protein
LGSLRRTYKALIWNTVNSSLNNTEKGEPATSTHQKVAIFARNRNFLSPIIRELKNRRTIIREYQYTSNEPYNAITAQDLLQWADCAFFDFLHPPLQLASVLTSVNCRITARLHGLEVYDHDIMHLNWPRINLIASEPQMLRWQRLKENTPLKAASEHAINLGVDAEPAASFRKQIWGYNVTLTAYTPLPRKRIYTTIESFFDLLHQTKQTGKNYPWQLNLRGLDVDPHGWRGGEAAEYVKFIDELESSGVELGFACDGGMLPITDNCHLDDAQWKCFLAGSDCIVSNSMQEGYHQSILQAMSYGTMPFVHRWLGADKIFPAQSLFLTQRELVDKMMTWAALSTTEKQKISSELQCIIREYHDEKKLAKQVVDVILGPNLEVPLK